MCKKKKFYYKFDVEDKIFVIYNVILKYVEYDKI